MQRNGQGAFGGGAWAQEPGAIALDRHMYGRAAASDPPGQTPQASRTDSGRRADFGALPVAVRPKSGPEGRFTARKHYCVLNMEHSGGFGTPGTQVFEAKCSSAPKPSPRPPGEARGPQISSKTIGFQPFYPPPPFPPEVQKL